MREVPPTAGLPLILSDLLPGPTAEFEASLARLLKFDAVQVVCSGTAALIVALKALQRRSTRREVVLPAYTCPLVALAVLHCGLRPVLCDLRPAHFDLDTASLDRICNQETLAIIPTHLGGRVADLAPVLEIAARCGAQVIEDAAQALGALWHGKPVGSIGEVGFYSLAVGKGLTLFEGGVLLARDARVRQEFLAIAAEALPHTLFRELKHVLALLGYGLLYRPFGLALAYGLPLRHALKRGKFIEAVGDDFPDEVPLHRIGSWRKAIGARALRRLPQFLQQTAAQAHRRVQRLAVIPGITVVTDMPGTSGVWPFFMILMASQGARDRALSVLWPAGLGVSRLYIHALPDYPYLADKLDHTEIPNARDFASRMLSISNSPWLDEAGFERICQVLESCATMPAATELPMHNLIEPAALVRHFYKHPPVDFATHQIGVTAAFSTRFDLTTTMETAQRRWLEKLPGWRCWRRLLQPRTLFIGTTVTEYVPMPQQASAKQQVADLQRAARDYAFLIVKDIPTEPALVGESAARYNQDLLEACRKAGFLLLEGQALAYVPIDFGAMTSFLERMSRARRKDMRRKLKSREDLTIQAVPTGDALFSGEAMCAAIYQLYRNVYDQSEIHFDLLTHDFFRDVLQDANDRGVVFLYRTATELIGFNLCFVANGMLIDKYIGLRYPQARQHNLYVISWFHNLEYALTNGLSHYVAGWTDPEVKRQLGASFTFTQHAVYIRNPLLRAVLRPFKRFFEADAQWHTQAR